MMEWKSKFNNKSLIILGGISMLRIGLIGAGGIAGVHAACYENMKEAKVVAVADIVPERAEFLAKKFGADALDHGDKILERADVDVVDICLPTYLHCEYVLKAAKAKKHILCEKPMALNIEQGLQMIEATKSAGVKFMVAQVLRFFPEYISAKNAMESGVIALPKIVRVYRGGGHPSRVREWYGMPEKSGGAIQDMLIHDIDYLKWCFGPAKEVYAKGNVFDKIPHFEYDMVTIEFQNGILAHLTADWSKPEGAQFVTKFEVAGTEGILQYDSQKSTPLTVVAAKQAGSKSSGVAVPESPLAKESIPFFKEIVGFLDAINKNIEPPIPAEEALDSLNIALCALESIKTNKPVMVKGVI